MPRLVINAGSPAAWEIQLRPGVNSLGRGAQNDFQIPHASVSGTHCQITVSDNLVLLRDLGSTNGTFIDRTQVLEAELRNGQALRLGEVDMVYYAHSAEAAGPAVEEHAHPAAFAGQPARVADVTGNTVILTRAASAPPGSPVSVGAQYCRFHPKMPARFMCERCQHYFCEACVATRSVSGVPHKFCRHCGAECVPVLAQFAPVVEKGFWARVPGAFLYPLRGVGVLIVVVGIILVAGLKLGEAAIEYRTLRMIIFGVIMEVFAGGYLFTFLQAIIHSTEAGDRELPDLPGMSNVLDDIVIPFGRLMTLSLVCFGPAAGLAIWMAVTHNAALLPALVIAVGLGYLYYPMAFLAVATLDSLGAANPLVVMTSIFRAPAEYCLPLLLLACVAAVQFFGGVLLNTWFPDGWTEQSIRRLFGMIGMMLFLSFLSLYLLIVVVHLLGLIFVTRKDRLAWLDR